jgi:hypothetical protein
MLRRRRRGGRCENDFSVTTEWTALYRAQLLPPSTIDHRDWLLLLFFKSSDELNYRLLLNLILRLQFVQDYLSIVSSRLTEQKRAKSRFSLSIGR